MKTIFNRIKSLLSQKAQPSPRIADARIAAAFVEVENYLTRTYCTPTSAITYEDYSDYALMACADETFSVTLAIYKTTNGLLGLPDNVLLVSGLKAADADGWFRDNRESFTNFLIALCFKSNISHLAFPDVRSGPTIRTNVPAEIPCYRLF